MTGRVLLSASFPQGARGQAFEPHDGAQIADACVHVSRALLRRAGTLVFGAHPTISPLVLAVAGELKVRQKVAIYQSRWFEEDVPAETRRLLERDFGWIEWTPKLATRGASLDAMRRAMVTDALAGAVFVGGMEGICKEFELAQERGVRCFVITAPGGAARTLRSRGTAASELNELVGTKFPELAARIADSVGLPAERRSGVDE